MLLRLRRIGGLSDPGFDIRRGSAIRRHLHGGLDLHDGGHRAYLERQFERDGVEACWRCLAGEYPRDILFVEGKLTDSLQIQCVGQCGTLLGTHSFPDSDEPLYKRGMWTGFAFSMAAATGCATLSFLFWKENRRRDRLYGKVKPVDGSVNIGAVGMSAEAQFRYII